MPGSSFLIYGINKDEGCPIIRRVIGIVIEVGKSQIIHQVYIFLTVLPINLAALSISSLPLDYPMQRNKTCLGATKRQALTIFSVYFGLGPDGSFARIPFVTVGIEEEELRSVAYQTGNSQEIAGVEGRERKIFPKMKFLTWSFGHEHNYSESYDCECQADKPCHHHYFKQTVGVSEKETDNIIKPHIVANAVEENTLHV